MSKSNSSASASASTKVQVNSNLDEITLKTLEAAKATLPKSASPLDASDLVKASSKVVAEVKPLPEQIKQAHKGLVSKVGFKTIAQLPSVRVVNTLPVLTDVSDLKREISNCFGDRESEVLTPSYLNGVLVAASKLYELVSEGLNGDLTEVPMRMEADWKGIVQVASYYVEFSTFWIKESEKAFLKRLEMMTTRTTAKTTHAEAVKASASKLTAYTEAVKAVQVAEANRDNREAQIKLESRNLITELASTKDLQALKDKLANDKLRETLSLATCGFNPSLDAQVQVTLSGKDIAPCKLFRHLDSLDALKKAGLKGLGYTTMRTQRPGSNDKIVTEDFIIHPDTGTIRPKI